MTAGYFDNAATAPMLPAALDAYVQAAQIVGNPSSVHAAGQRVRAVVETGRRQVAASLGADPAEVIFTSGGTESINQAIKGIYWARAAGGQRPIVIVADGEHHASLEAARWLAEAQGAELRLAPIDHQARLDLDWLAGEIDREGARIALISVLWANNEVGTVQPIKRVCALAAVASIPVHVDAVSAYGQVPIDMHAAGCHCSERLGAQNRRARRHRRAAADANTAGGATAAWRGSRTQGSQRHTRRTVDRGIRRCR